MKLLVILRFHSIPSIVHNGTYIPDLGKCLLALMSESEG